jgi:hypothetical protein
MFIGHQVRPVIWHGGASVWRVRCSGSSSGRARVAVCAGVRRRSHDIRRGGRHHSRSQRIVSTDILTSQFDISYRWETNGLRRPTEGYSRESGRCGPLRWLESNLCLGPKRGR